jgi:hypothetical protein
LRAAKKPYRPKAGNLPLQSLPFGTVAVSLRQENAVQALRHSKHRAPQSRQTTHPLRQPSIARNIVIARCITCYQDHHIRTIDVAITFHMGL